MVAPTAYRAAMALVRKGVLAEEVPALGAPEPPAVVGTAPVPRQPITPPGGVARHPGAPPPISAPPAAPPISAPPFGPPVSAPPVGPPAEEAAAAPTMPASAGAVASAFVMVAVGGAIAYAMPATHPFRITNAMTAYVALLVFAAAVERLLEPFSHWLPGTKARNDYEASIAAMMNGWPNASLSMVAQAKAGLDRAIGNRAVLIWGLATAISTVVASASGFYLLRMVNADTWNPTVSPWLDALITGLIVGSGTKPLHDVISRVQSASSGKG